MAQSSIEWTEMTWNPTSGCDKLSSGCKHCYAEKMAFRLQSMGLEKYKNGFQLTLQPDSLLTPYSWKKPKIVFVNSMSDLFHKDVPLSYIKKVFKVMKDCSHHTFQVLTKRADLLLKYDKELEWSKNIWMGVSVENYKVIDRIDYLKRSNAYVKFLSIEPLLGPIPDLNLEKIDWVIVGGESGFKARPIKEEWVIDLKNQCKKARVPFFFKQWGGINKKKAGRVLEGQTFDEMPQTFL